MHQIHYITNVADPRNVVDLGLALDVKPLAEEVRQKVDFRDIHSFVAGELHTLHLVDS